MCTDFCISELLLCLDFGMLIYHGWKPYKLIPFPPTFSAGSVQPHFLYVALQERDNGAQIV